MSTDDWRWEQKAQRLRFDQLDIARKQAENWRTGLAGVTTLLSAVLIVKGRDNVSDLSTPYRWTVTVLFGVALGCLAVATVLALRAASGTPTRQSLLSGKDLSTWTAGEVLRIRSALTWAAMLTIGGVALVAAAVGTAWLSPTTASSSSGLVTVQVRTAKVCGVLMGISNGNLVISQGSTPRRAQSIPLATVDWVSPTSSC